MDNNWHLTRRCYKFNVQRSTATQEYILKISVLGGGTNWNFFMITSIWGKITLFRYVLIAQILIINSSNTYPVLDTISRLIVNFGADKYILGRKKDSTTFVASPSCTKSKICAVYLSCFVAETTIIKWIENYNLEVEKCFGRTAVEHEQFEMLIKNNSFPIWAK